MVLFVDLIFEEHLVQVQTKGDGTHHDRMSFMASLLIIVSWKTDISVRAAYFEEIHHCLPKSRRIAFLRPVVSPSFVPVATDLHSLFRVWRLVALFRYLCSVCGLRDKFAADLHIAAVSPRVLPRKFILG